MIRNVLLMLSTDQAPDPIQELQWHADRSANTAKTAFATTRILSGMTRGKSIVAFYGNAELGNRLLGYGTFAGYALLAGPRGKQLLSATELYDQPQRPKGLKGMIELTDVHISRLDEGIETLGGFIEGNKTPLIAANFPDGPARLQIYFTRRGP